MTRKYDGPKLHHGAVHYPAGHVRVAGNGGQLRPATSSNPPTLTKGAVADPKDNFAGHMQGGAKLPPKAAAPGRAMLSQNIGKGPAVGHLGMNFSAGSPRSVKQTVTPKVDKAPLMIAPAGVGKSDRAKAERKLMAQERAAAKSDQALAGKLTARGGPGMPQDGHDGHQAPMRQPSAQAQRAGNSGRAQGPLGNARRGFGRDATGYPFKASR